MSRSGYVYDYGGWDLARWRGAVSRAINGKRGQTFLREMLAALDALPAPKLIADKLMVENGEVCAIGAVGRARGMDMTLIDPEIPYDIAKAFGIAEALVMEIEDVNDENDWNYGRGDTPEERFKRVRAWVEANLRPE